MGEVWKARDTRLNRIVAITCVKPQSAARFEQEARAIAALNHPHVCQIFDVGADYLVLEFVEGVPLRGPLSAAEALPLALQIARALEAAHERGILHCRKAVRKAVTDGTLCTLGVQVMVPSVTGFFTGFSLGNLQAVAFESSLAPAGADDGPPGEAKRTLGRRGRRALDTERIEIHEKALVH